MESVPYSCKSNTPFRNYNLFAYVDIFSFYNRAKEDKRFLEALKTLESKMVDGQIAGLSFCKKGKVSPLATKRYHEILKKPSNNEITSIATNGTY